MKKFLIVFALLLLVASPAFAMSCKNQQGMDSDECWTQVTVAPGETTLVSPGTVLVYDLTSNGGDPSLAAWQVRVATASAKGTYVAGVAQRRIASGASDLVLVRGLGYVATKAQDTIASGTAVFVSTSGDVSAITSTTQTQLGVAMASQTAGTNTRTTQRTYVTIV